jgi:hypothetical protein
MRLPSQRDLGNQQGLFEYLSQLAREQNRLEEMLSRAGGRSEPVKLPTMDEIRQALEADGTHPLSIEGLYGQGLSPQAAVVKVVTALPDARDYIAGTIVVLDGSPDTLHYRTDTNPPAWATISLASAGHDLLSASHSDTLAGTVVRGDVIVGNSTPAWSRLARGTAYQHLRMNSGATDPIWSGEVAVPGANGSLMLFTYATELLTLSNVAAFTDATLAIPSGLIVMGVVGYVTQAISGGGVTSFSVGDSGVATRWLAASTSLTAGSTFLGLNHWRGSVAADNAGPIHTGGAALPVRVTCDAIPTQGQIRIVVFVAMMSAPIS